MGLEQTQVYPISRERPERGKEEEGPADFNNSFQQSGSSLNRCCRLFLKALHFVPDLWADTKNINKQKQCRSMNMMSFQFLEPQGDRLPQRCLHPHNILEGFNFKEENIDILNPSLAFNCVKSFCYIGITQIAFKKRIKKNTDCTTHHTSFNIDTLSPRESMSYANYFPDTGFLLGPLNLTCIWLYQYRSKVY